MIVLSYEDIKKLSKRRPGPRRIPPVKAPARPERELRKRLENLWRSVLHPASETIQQMVKDRATLVQIADYMQSILTEAENVYGFAAKDITWRWAADVNRMTRISMQEGLIHSLGVDILTVLDSPTVADAMSIGGQAMANLIVTIPREYLANVAKAVYDNLAGTPLPEGRNLLQQIKFIGGSEYTQRHARLVARDQTSKLTSLLDMTRQQSIGIDEYDWSTVQDARVVGTPDGRYPKATRLHGNHYRMNGLRCKWSDPSVFSDDHGKTWKKRSGDMPKTNVGIDIQCRCFGHPIIDIQKIIKYTRAA